MQKKKSSDAKIRANARYNQKKYDVLSIRVLKTEHINDRLDLAVEKTGLSKASYVVGAINARLEDDGIQPVTM